MFLTGMDPFLGSGTTMKVAMSMNRNAIGYELDKSLKPIIKKKVNQVNKEKHRIKFKTRKVKKFEKYYICEKLNLQHEKMPKNLEQLLKMSDFFVCRIVNPSNFIALF